MIVSLHLNIFVIIHHFSKRRHQLQLFNKTNEVMAFAMAENTDINSVHTTLPKNSLCLGQISSISDNRQPFLHPYNKGLIILAKHSSCY